MVRIINFLHLGLYVPLSLARIHGHSALSGHKNVQAAHVHSNTQSKVARDTEASLEDLNQVYHGLKIARDAVQTQGQMIQVSEDSLNTMLKEIKDLEAQVSKLLPASPSGAPESNAADDDDCSFDDTSSVGGTPAQVSGKPSRRNAHCKIGALAGKKFNVNADEAASIPLRISDPPMSAASSPNPTQDASIPLGNGDISKELTTVVLTSTDSMDHTTRVTLTRTHTQTHVISLGFGAHKAQATPPMDNASPATNKTIPPQTSTTMAQEKIEDVEDTRTSTANLKAPWTPMPGKIRPFMNQTVKNNLPVDAKSPALPNAQTTDTTPMSAPKKAHQFFDAVTQNVSTTAESPSGFRTVVLPRR